MFQFLAFFFGILSSFCFLRVKNEARDDNNNPWKWEPIWIIFMAEYINGIKKKNKKIIFLGTSGFVLLALAITCFILYPKYD